MIKPNLLKVTIDDLDNINNVQKNMFGDDALKKDIVESLVLGGLFLKLDSYNENNKLIGFIAIGLTGELIYPKIYSLAIISKYRNTGYGSYLLKSALKKLPEYLKLVDNDDEYYKFDKIALYVRKNNQNALKFFMKFDFEIISKEENYYSNGEAAYYMEKTILNKIS